MAVVRTEYDLFVECIWSDSRQLGFESGLTESLSLDRDICLQHRKKDPTRRVFIKSSFDIASRRCKTNLEEGINHNPIPILSNK